MSSGIDIFWSSVMYVSPFLSDSYWSVASRRFHLLGDFFGQRHRLLVEVIER